MTDLEDQFAELPEAFQMREDNGQFTTIKDPVYNLLADGFYGSGDSAMLFAEGEIIVTHDVPNEHMQPLNQAAARNYLQWRASLPTSDVQINIDDLVEATNMIAANPKMAQLDADERSEAVRRLALELKRKRDTVGGMALPPIAGHTNETIRARKSAAPAMLGAKFTEVTPRGPGQIGSAAVIHEPNRKTGSVRAARQTLGAEPRASRQQTA